MSTNEVKDEINKVLDTAPDEVLESILNYLKELLSKNKQESLLSSNLNRILLEDKDLLDRLSK